MKMPTYKGNAGHLMQHWTLCEILVTANKHTAGLNYIDAHAMAPLATERQVGDVHFDNVKNCSPSSGESAYELAWHQLAPHGGYPNSAAFVKEVWKGDFSLLLCEIEPETCKKIDEDWLPSVRQLANCQTAKLYRGDWLERFKKGLPQPTDVGLADGSLTMVSFDPDMYNRNRRRRNSRNLYPYDLETAMRAMDCLGGCGLIQLSTYNVNDNNPQGAVISSVNQIMVANDFQLLAVVPLDKRMMTLVYTRNVSWAYELADLPDRFDKWLSMFWPGRWVEHLHPDRVELRRRRVRTSQ